MEIEDNCVVSDNCLQECISVYELGKHYDKTILKNIEFLSVRKPHSGSIRWDEYM
jgi:ferredoxin